MSETNLTNGELFKNFLNGVVGARNATDTLHTEELPNGNVGLYSYNARRIAERDSNSGMVTVYRRHGDTSSQTTLRHVRGIKHLVPQSKLIVSAQTPIDRPELESVKYIDNYRPFNRNPSKLEARATADVRRVCRSRFE